MRDDFFSELSDVITKTVQDVSDRTDKLIEIQKKKTKIVTEKREIEKLMAAIGKEIYKKFLDGETMEESLHSLCVQINQKQIFIAKCRESIARMRGHKICPQCGADVPLSAAFCMRCGTACEQDEDEDLDEMFKEAEEDWFEDEEDLAEEMGESAGEDKKQEETVNLNKEECCCEGDEQDTAVPSYEEQVQQAAEAAEAETILQGEEKKGDI